MADPRKMASKASLHPRKAPIMASILTSPKPHPLHPGRLVVDRGDQPEQPSAHQDSQEGKRIVRPDRSRSKIGDVPVKETGDLERRHQESQQQTAQIQDVRENPVEEIDEGQNQKQAKEDQIDEEGGCQSELMP